MNPFLSMIMLWPCNFAINGWHYCDGTLLAISQNAALFSLLGTTYGGDGITTFGLPDFRGRVPVGAGAAAPGRSAYALGQSGGSETVTLTLSQMPAHNHPLSITINASNVQATTAAPSAPNNVLAAPYDGTAFNSVFGYNNSAPNTALNVGTLPTTTGITGSSTPVPNLQPYLAVSYIIALQGIFPSRS